MRQGQQAYVLNPDGVPTIGVRAKVQGHALTLNYEALPELTLKSITAYRKYRQDGTNSLSGNGVLKGFTLNPILFVDGTVIPEGINTVNPYDGYTPQRQRQISQEFQALGKSGDFSYVAGAFYFNEKSSEANFQQLTFVLPGGDAGVNLAPLQAFRGTAESYALFGQTSYTPNGGNLELTAGLRYTWDQKTLLLAGDVNPPRPARAAFENLSWLLSANYKFSNAAMAYVRASSGFRSGGINPASSTINTFAPEKVVSYEGGIKAEWFDRRLRTNLAAFYVDYKDLQISQFEAGSGGATSTIINAGKVVYKGIEAEITAIPVDGLTLDMSFGYTDPTYKTYLYRDPQTDMVTNVANEARMSQTAKFNSHIGAQYEADIGFATLSLRTDYAYRSTIYWFTLDRINKFNRELRSRPDHNLRARIGLAGIEVGGGALDLSLWGDNLTNDRNIDFGIDFGDLGFGSASFKKPRTLGIDAKLTY
ncbi:TonB-dependent receptor [Sphingomonas sp. KC8]|uniref:TonB-dependent receptor n=1 Tax=Sphingomonas sp. KC8 TaxID=1030157 RepID=UPI0002E624BF|nr:TonB-dependent receptor [Sphingomonas sp. KC8]